MSRNQAHEMKALDVSLFAKSHGVLRDWPAEISREASFSVMPLNWFVRRTSQYELLQGDSLVLGERGAEGL